MSRKFTVIDEGFTCAVCNAVIPPLNYTARDHCRECLCSLHLDIHPGDRQSGCGGILRPVGLELNKKGQQILYRCEKCGADKRNITADDDNYDRIVELSASRVFFL
jgi:hypothetical protein